MAASGCGVTDHAESGAKGTALPKGMNEKGAVIPRRGSLQPDLPWMPAFAGMTEACADCLDVLKRSRGTGLLFVRTPFSLLAPEYLIHLVLAQILRLVRIFLGIGAFEHPDEGP